MQLLIVLSLCAAAVLAFPANQQCPAGMQTVCDALKACKQTAMNGQAMPTSGTRTRPTAEQKAAMEAAMKACVTQRGITEDQLNQLKASMPMNGPRQGAVTQG